MDTPKYVVPPQDMPPFNPQTGKRGFINLKYRMSTLQPKGLTIPQILASFVLLVGSGFVSQRYFDEHRNARAMSLAVQTVAQRAVFDTFYTQTTRASPHIHPIKNTMGGLNPLPLVEPVDQRSELVVKAIGLEEQREKVYNFRASTFDSAVAPYHVCHGPEHYSTPHICNQFCISPAEVHTVRYISDLKLEKLAQNAQNAKDHAH